MADDFDDGAEADAGSRGMVIPSMMSSLLASYLPHVHLLANVKHNNLTSDQLARATLSLRSVDKRSEIGEGIVDGRGRSMEVTCGLEEAEEVEEVSPTHDLERPESGG
jgi:hypothetical protein